MLDIESKIYVAGHNMVGSAIVRHPQLLSTLFRQS